MPAPGMIGSDIGVGITRTIKLTLAKERHIVERPHGFHRRHESAIRRHMRFALVANQIPAKSCAGNAWKSGFTKSDESWTAAE